MFEFSTAHYDRKSEERDAIHRAALYVWQRVVLVMYSVDGLSGAI